MATAEEVAAQILLIVGQSTSHTISGGRLSELLKHHFPGFVVLTYGAKNLRAFIHRHLSGQLEEVGQVGTDIVYGLPGASPPPQARPIATGHLTQEVIKVFRSPNAHLELHVNRETGVIHVAARNSAVHEPWCRIKPTGPDTLQQIVTDFVSNLAPEHRTRMTLILGETPWWPKFSAYLQDYNLYKSWAAFKNSQLRAKLESELRSVGVVRSSTPIPALSEATVDDDAHDEPRPPSPVQIPLPVPPPPPPAVSLAPWQDASPVAVPRVASDELRDAIIRVVQSLPIADLRNLRLPVGDVYDALKQQR